MTERLGLWSGATASLDTSGSSCMMIIVRRKCGWMCVTSLISLIIAVRQASRLGSSRFTRKLSHWDSRWWSNECSNIRVSSSGTGIAVFQYLAVIVLAEAVDLDGPKILETFSNEISTIISTNLLYCVWTYCSLKYFNLNRFYYWASKNQFSLKAELLSDIRTVWKCSFVYLRICQPELIFRHECLYKRVRGWMNSP